MAPPPYETWAMGLGYAAAAEHRRLGVIRRLLRLKRKLGLAVRLTCDETGNLRGTLRRLGQYMVRRETLARRNESWQRQR